MFKVDTFPEGVNCGVRFSNKPHEWLLYQEGVSSHGERIWFNVDMMGEINNIKQPCCIWIHLGLLKTGITLDFGYPVVRHKQHLSFGAVKLQTSANTAPCSSSECNRRTFSLGPTTSFSLHPQVHQYDIRTGHEIGSQLRELPQIKPSVLPSAYIYI